MNRPLSWLSAGFLVCFAGVGAWLFVAPFVIHYQPRGARLVPATVSDMITGAALIGVTLLALAGYLGLAVRARLHAAVAGHDEETTERTA